MVLGAGAEGVVVERSQTRSKTVEVDQELNEIELVN